MSTPASTSERRGLGAGRWWVFLIGAIVSFHLAYAHHRLSFFIVLFLFCLQTLRKVSTPRRAFYSGLLAGYAVYAPQLHFFWGIFGPASLALWLVLSFWIGLFILMAHVAERHLPSLAVAGLLPMLWTGIEYFRSELYFLRFTWLNAGYAFAEIPNLHLAALLGNYGIGFVLMAFAAVASIASAKRRAFLLATGLLLGAVVVNLPSANSRAPEGGKAITVTGIQLEFPGHPETVSALNRALALHPATDIFVLSEYTFDGPVPDGIKAWCRTHRKHLIAGGKQPAGNTFYNTAFVIGPDGEIAFRQVKAVPIQFFNDGLPAPEQAVWQSPWGKIGLCVCYDLGYTRVIDKLIRLGAEAVIAPTMDVAEWGARQHELHALIAPMRSAEYRIPIFRLASSGISQLVRVDGTETARASFPGPGEILSGRLVPSSHTRLPIDRLLAPLCTAFTAGFAGVLVILSFRKHSHSKPSPPSP